jgi:hypothetical protein
MTTKIYTQDIATLQSALVALPKRWDGRQCVLELKDADYQWRQMEWWAFYFEHKAKQLLGNAFTFPGDRFGNAGFDLKGAINWDLKASAIKTNNHNIILNDCEAMEQSIAQCGFHGENIALCDVEYNDVNRTFQQWHTELKGGKSNYETQREQRTSISRYRKTSAELTEIILLVLNKESLDKLAIMRQGRNANGAPRKEKYMLDVEAIDNFETYIIKI